MICKECLHVDVCGKLIWKETDGSIICNDYKNRSRYVELPCEIGNTVYCIRNHQIVTDKVVDYDIWSIKDGIKLRLTLDQYRSYIVGSLGVDVFLTLQEAEAAIRRMNDE